MIIVYVSHGTFIHTYPYIEYFKEQGHEVHFIALTPTNYKQVNIQPAWFHYDVILLKKLGKLSYLFSAFKTKKIIRKLQPDIVHAHYATSGGLVTWVVGHENTILTVHGSDVNTNTKSMIWRYLLKKIFKKVKIVNVVSHELQAKVHSFFKVPLSKIVNINVGIDYDNYYIDRSHSKQQDFGLKILCNRSFEPIYDHYTIFNGLKVIHERGIPFKATFLGEGSLKRQFEIFVSQNNLNNSISFLGRIDNSKQPEIFKQHNIFVSASLSDGTSLSLLEAMASGLYPIISNIESNRIILGERFTSSMFTPRDHIQFANLLEDVFKKGSIDIDTLTRNQSIVLTIGHRKRNMGKIESLYRSIVYSTQYKKQ